MKAATHQERKEAEALLTDHYVEKINSNMWGTFRNDGTRIDRGSTKTIALFHAVSAEGKLDQLID